MRYKCIGDFPIDVYDEDGRFTQEQILIKEGSLWETEETDYRFIGGKDTIRLVSDIEGNSYRWIEITEENLSRHFTPTVEGREIPVGGVFKHFKHTITGIPLNYMYVVMGISKPVTFEVFTNIGILPSTNSSNFVQTLYTEEHKKITTIRLEGGVYIHSVENCDSDLVVYKSLYDDSLPYSRPLDMFAGFVDHEKYPEITQGYRFELVGRILG